MPIAKYFVVVGSALAVLLLIAGWSLPEPFAHLYILKKRRIVTRRHGVSESHERHEGRCDHVSVDPQIQTFAVRRYVIRSAVSTRMER